MMDDLCKNLSIWIDESVLFDFVFGILFIFVVFDFSLGFNSLIFVVFDNVFFVDSFGE